MRKRAFSWLLRAWSRLGVRTARLEGRIAGRDLMIRLYQFGDLPALRRLFKPEVFSAASGSRVNAFGSSASLWGWVRRTFQVFYVIEVDKRERRGMIGFAGIYNMDPGNSLWVSLVIFDPKDRRRGYGTRALELLLSSFQKDHVVKRVCGEVLASNTGSLRFLKKLGFDVFAEDRDRVLLKSVGTGVIYLDRAMAMTGHKRLSKGE
jgi:RimJ/RimL family protein N-acetyltransferase